MFGFKFDLEYMKNQIKEDAETYNKELLKLAFKMESAAKNKKNSCQKCGFCCHKCPCDFTKDDLINSAIFFGVSDKEFFKSYMNVKFYGPNKFVLQPIRKSQKKYAGKQLPINEHFSTSPCIFLTKNNLCMMRKIHPSGARTASCWKPDETMHLLEMDDLKYIYELSR